MLYIQLIGLLAFLVLVLSFYKKDTIKILIYQMTSNFAYAVHYFLLGAISGAFVSIVSIIRNILFLCVKGKRKIIVPVLAFLYLSCTYIFYENIYSILPAIANITYMMFMLKNSRKWLLKGETICALMWLIYGIFVKSYSEMLAESILFISTVIQLSKYKKSKDT